MSQLTFIIPAYNAAKTLAETIASVRAQTLTTWRAVIIDDGSTDSTATLARSTSDPRITVISQPNEGLAGARNTGLAHATTPFISFLDADDTIDPAFAATMLTAIGNHDAAACAYDLVGPNHEPLNWTIRPAPHDTLPERIIETNPLAVTGLFRCEALLRLDLRSNTPQASTDDPTPRPVGAHDRCQGRAPRSPLVTDPMNSSPRRGERLAPINVDNQGPQVFNPNLPVLEDWDLWLRATAWRWKILDQPLFRYRLVPGLSRNIELMWTTGLKVIFSAPVPDHLKPRALRRWTLRSAARALANQDHLLADIMLAHAGTLTDDDLTTLASALTPAFQRAKIVGPAEAHMHHSRWRCELEAALRAQPWLPSLLHLFDTLTTDWSSVARHIATSLRATDIPTIYGMGWNGQALITHLATLFPNRTIAWLDDNPHAAPPASIQAHRITPDSITPDHAIAITPNSAAPILARLQPLRATIIWPHPQPRAA